MKPPKPIEILEFRQPDIVPSDPRVRVATALLLSEVHLGGVPTAEQIDLEIAHLPQDMLYFVAVQEGSQVVGVASVQHTKAKTTVVEGLAVVKTERRQGYAMQLIGHIARAAIAQTSEYIEFVPVKRRPVRKFMESFGSIFTKHQNAMRATPQDVLQKATPH